MLSAYTDFDNEQQEGCQGKGLTIVELNSKLQLTSCAMLGYITGELLQLLAFADKLSSRADVYFELVV